MLACNLWAGIFAQEKRTQFPIQGSKGGTQFPIQGHLTQTGQYSGELTVNCG